MFSKPISVAADLGDSPALRPGEMRFLDPILPKLPAGTYKLVVSQSLKATTPDASDDVDIPAQTKTQAFVADGPRFSLNSDEVAHRFPPANSQGVFATALPQVLLTHPAIPWERAVWNGENDAPWMALIVLTQDEVLAPTIGSNVNAPSFGTGSTTITVGDLQSPETGTLTCDPSLAAYEDPAAPVTVVDITPQTFATVMPVKTTLQSLGALRATDIRDKAAGGPRDADTSGQPVEDAPATRVHAVLNTHRFPQNPASNADVSTNIVHLVSLEGFTQYLTGDAPVAPQGYERVRLVSLAAWSFDSLHGGGQSFADLMQGLEPRPGDDLWLRITPPPNVAPTSNTDAMSYASNALGGSYVPLSYRTRQGETTFAWYRGPFVAALPAQLPAFSLLPQTSAQLAIYDDTRALFDMSYAAAFETGRLMGLSSKAFSSALSRWQRVGLRLLNRMVDLAQIQGADLAAMSKTQVQAMLNAPAASRVAFEGLVDALPKIGAGLGAGTGVSSESTLHRNLPPQGLDKAVISAALETTGVQGVLAEWVDETAAPILGFLSRLWLFEGVPFNRLVPDHRLLPPESLRCFYIDRNWRIAALYGALSIGGAGSQVAALRGRLFQALLPKIETRAAERRAGLLGIAVGNVPDPETPQAGCLIRSAAVSGWPHLQIQAFHGANLPDPASGHAPNAGQRADRAQITRMTRLAPSIMLVMFDRVPDWIEVEEPREGLHNGTESNNQVFLRSMTDEDPGQEIGSDAYVTAQIDPDSRILDVAQLVADIGAAPALASAFAAGVPNGPGTFALQTIAVPERMVFRTSFAEDDA